MEITEDQSEEQRHLQETLNILNHRLRLLELRKTKQGDETPAHVQIEIDDTRQEIDLIVAKLRRLRVDPAIVAKVGPEGWQALLEHRIQTIDRDMRSGLAMVWDEIATSSAKTDEWREQQDVERKRGALVNRRVFIALAVALGLNTVALLLLLGALVGTRLGG